MPGCKKHLKTRANTLGKKPAKPPLEPYPLVKIRFYGGIKEAYYHQSSSLSIRITYHFCVHFSELGVQCVPLGSSSHLPTLREGKRQMVNDEGRDQRETLSNSLITENKLSNEKDYKIIVNGTEHKVPQAIVTFEQVVALEYPNEPPSATMTYKVTYEKAESKPHQGTLAPGGKVEVKKKGTQFDVVQANRS